MANTDDWIGVQEASRQCSVAKRTITHWINKGKLSAKKVKGKWLIDPESLSAIGKGLANTTARSASDPTIAVPLERYEALITRLAQLETENEQYRLMLEDKRRSWWQRLTKRGS